jgi:hypothetical protein
MPVDTAALLQIPEPRFRLPKSLPCLYIAPISSATAVTKALMETRETTS